MNTKVTFFLAVFFLSINVIKAQQTLNETMLHGGIIREYIVYVPASYDGESPVPLMFNFHGWTQSAHIQMNLIGDMRAIADTAGFILVYPQGSLFQGSTHWNVGSWTAGSTADDIGFTEAMIDTIATNYNVNINRIYSCGYSNGGFFSYELACQLSNRIAAIGSVAGSMSTETYSNGNPSHPTPIVEIHGTNDPIITYSGSSPAGYNSVTDVLSFWINYNNTDSSPIVTTMPDLNSADRSTVEYQSYKNGDSGTMVEHYKVIGGGHVWPNINGDPANVNVDISASDVIWNFVSNYDINGIIIPSGVVDLSKPIIDNFELAQNYPNPFNPSTTIKYGIPEESNIKLEIFNMLGQSVRILVKGNKSAGFYETTWNAENLPSGTYLIRISAEGLSSKKSFTQVKKALLLK